MIIGKINISIFWLIIDLIIIHLGRNPSNGGRPPKDKNRIIRDRDKAIGLFVKEEMRFLFVLLECIDHMIAAVVAA